MKYTCAWNINGYSGTSLAKRMADVLDSKLETDIQEHKEKYPVQIYIIHNMSMVYSMNLRQR